MNDNELLGTVEDIVKTESESLKYVVSNLPEHAVIDVVKEISECKGKILVTGCGTSGMAARKIAHTLCVVGRPTSFLNPADATHGELGLVCEGDVVIFISKGGKTSELYSMIESCRKLKAKLIAVTENTDSYIAKQADIVLDIKVDKEADPFHMMATTSTLAVISVFDGISMAALKYTNFTKDKFAVIHPGGAVGEKLSNL